MKLSLLFTTTGQSFTYYPSFCARFGISVNACVLLCFLGWHTKPGEEDEWLEWSADDITHATGLSHKEQAGARKSLKAMGLIEDKYARLEHQLRFRIIGEIDVESGNGHSTKGQMPIRLFVESTINGKEVSKERVHSQFQKPTLEEAQLAVEKIGLPLAEAQKFINYYESNGWRVGRNPMKSWLGAIANWKTRWEEFRSQRSNNVQKPPLLSKDGYRIGIQEMKL